MLQKELIDTYYVCAWCDRGISATTEGTHAWIDRENWVALHLACKEKQESADASRLTFYTTCPDRYDGFGTRDEGVVGKTEHGKDVRKVTILPEALAWQEGRYSSGLGGPYDQASYDYQVKGGWIIPSHTGGE